MELTKILGKIQQFDTFFKWSPSCDSLDKDITIYNLSV